MDAYDFQVAGKITLHKVYRFAIIYKLLIINVV